MKETLLLLLIFSLLIFNSCSRKQLEETSPETIPCNIINLALPQNSYEKDDEYSIVFNYYTSIDRPKKNADSIINLYLSEKSNLDSLFLALDNYKETLLKDSLKEEKWVGICIKIPQMPLNTFLKIACNFQVKEIKLWLLDFRYDEITFFFCNKKNQSYEKLSQYFSKKEYADYIKNADFDALKKIEDLTEDRQHSFSFRTNSLENYVVERLTKSAKITTNFHWNNSNVSSQQLDSLSNLISDFKNKYQKTLEIEYSDTIIICERKAFSVHFEKNIPLTEIIKIINMIRKNKLIFDVDCVENQIKICTLCSKDEPYKFR